MEDKLKELKKIQQQKSEASSSLLTEANDKLSKAINKNNLVQANIAQGLIQAAHKLSEESRDVENESQKIQRRINKRKSDLMFYSKKRRY